MASQNGPLTVQQACAALGVTGGYIRRLLIRGDLPGTKFGTQWSIRASDVEKLRGTVGRRSKKAQAAARQSKPKRR